MADSTSVEKAAQGDEHFHIHKNTKAIINRLSRIEGHVRSIKTMVEEGRDCPEILIQIAAVRSAINQTGKVVLEDHLESCLFHAGISPDENEVWLSVKDVFEAYF
jgi:DNA-binding FrmR family transcriptional regulator